jgi:hypothetical protein
LSVEANRDDNDDRKRTGFYFAAHKTALGVGGLSRWKRSLVTNGPLVLIMRLTQQMYDFKGDFFCPTEELQFHGSDGSPIAQNAPKETWGNHFVVMDGYGVDPARGEYILVQNSWGEIYDLGKLPESYSASYQKSSFFKICTSILGANKLEMTTRIGYEIKDFTIRGAAQGWFGQNLPKTPRTYDLDADLRYGLIFHKKNRFF